MYIPFKQKRSIDKIDHIRGHKASLNKFQITETIQHILNRNVIYQKHLHIVCLLLRDGDKEPEETLKTLNLQYDWTWSNLMGH